MAFIIRAMRTALCTLLLLLPLGPGCSKSDNSDAAKTNAKPAHDAAAPEDPAKSAASATEKTAATAESAKPKEAAPAQPTELPEGASLEKPPADLRAPDTYAVEFDTTQGPIVIDVTRAWAPIGADRFFTAVKLGYYDDVAFFRVISGFMAQVGIHGDGSVNGVWRERRIADDPVKESNTRGMVSFATAGPNTRTTQFFINFSDNKNLDGMGFAPFGKVRDMKVVDKLYNGYGEGAPRGKGPDQGRAQAEGNTYLKKEFPKLDFIKKASVVTTAS